MFLVFVGRSECTLIKKYYFVLSGVVISQGRDSVKVTSSRPTGYIFIKPEPLYLIMCVNFIVGFLGFSQAHFVITFQIMPRTSSSLFRLYNLIKPLANQK
jgi:hypothetical protein